METISCSRALSKLDFCRVLFSIFGFSLISFSSACLSAGVIIKTFVHAAGCNFGVAIFGTVGMETSNFFALTERARWFTSIEWSILFRLHYHGCFVRGMQFNCQQFPPCRTMLCPKHDWRTFHDSSSAMSFSRQKFQLGFCIIST